MKRLLTLTTLLFSLLAAGHEGHSLPGAIPPAENAGGKVAEATNKGTHELFFEAWRADGKVRLQPKNAASETEWTKIAPAEIKNLAVTIETGRGARKKVTTTADGEAFTVDAKGIEIQKPFTLHIEALFQGEKKKAKLAMGKK